MRARRGSSIIETMLVVVLTSVVSGIVMSLLVLLHRCDRNVQEELTKDVVLARLEIQLRHDLHRAQSAQLNDDTLNLQRSTDQSVAYFFDSEGLHRQVKNDAEEVISRDLFHLPRGMHWQWQLEDRDGQSWLTFVLHPQGSTASMRTEYLVHYEIRVGHYIAEASP